ncbi:hypothetical protein AAF712_012883 [Marasmius tenuissimus]|uniref:Uncharacterized protein n=1 Tax=Marasmius tenuissimus TaxID=585030 RepID=A0ABR2ZFA1_9AGAR
MPLYICGFILLGASYQKHLNTGALIMGWGIAETSVMINTGEISALINLARVLGGFSVAYFQVPWANKNGALQTFGVEAAIVVALFILVVPALQIYGKGLRNDLSIISGFPLSRVNVGAGECLLVDGLYYLHRSIPLRRMLDLSTL